MRALSSEEEMSHPNPRKHAAMSRRTGRADQRRQPAPAHPTMVSDNPIFFREDDDGCTDALAAVGKPLPLPPSRAHLSEDSGRAASALVMSRHGSGWVLRRVPHHDPFLAAYVACSKGGGGGKVDSAPGKKQQKKNKNKNRGDAVQGCGIWSGWAAGAMSCKYGCDVAAVQAQESTVPRLHLSRQLVVIPARNRAMARGRAQD
uniref:Uncharacterized protein n=1 Tax=Avena sativa TaxID=4498 RepID=A0ACD5X3V2_AVESA